MIKVFCRFVRKDECMDIKSALNQIIPIQTRAKSNVEKPLKMDGATERDGNGQQAYQNPNQNKQPMSDQEFDYSVKLLETFPAILDHSLILEVVKQENRRFVLIKEPNGTVLRRVTEDELASLLESQDTDPKKGQLISKSA